MTTAQPSSNSEESMDPCVAEFLARHGLDDEDGCEVLHTIVQTGKEMGSDVARTIVADLETNDGDGETESPAPASASNAIVADPEHSGSTETTSALPKRRESDATMRQLRSVANSISVSISKSNLLREKLKEATRLLLLGFVSGALALFLAYVTTSVRSVVFFAALFTLVLGLISTYRSTMIMTKLSRIAKI